MAGRWLAIDGCRGLALVAIVYVHALGMTYSPSMQFPAVEFVQLQVLNSFIMPLFYLISGAVARTSGVMDAVRAAFYLILVALAVHVLGWLCMQALGAAGWAFEVVPHWRSLVRPFLALDRFSPVVVWYLASLALVQLLFAALVAAGPVLRSAIVLAVIAAALLHHQTGKTIFQIATVPAGLVFYGLGRLAASKGLRQAVDAMSTPRLAAACVALAGLAWALLPLNKGCAWSPVNTCFNHGDAFITMMMVGRLGFLPFFILSALIGAAWVFTLAALLARSGPLASRVLSYLGQQTLPLLIINGFVMLAIQPALMDAFWIAATKWSGMLWAFGVTAVQLALLPAWVWLIRPLTQGCRRLADSITGVLASAARSGPSRAL